MSRRSPRPVSLAARLAWITGSALLAVVLAEGAASLGTVLWRAVHRGPIAERSHTRYDPELGWVHRPGAVLPDLYRPGATVTIDGAGFRAAPALAADTPRERWACSGDSFTFGYGVDDGETWCALLQARRQGVATVNLGQGGYGLDQVFLWYRREALALHPTLHLLALDVHLFPRLGRSDLAGYGKPVVRLVDGRLEVANQPVPRRAFAHPWWTGLQQSLRELRLAGLVASSSGTVTAPDDLAPIAARLVAESAALDRRLGARLVLVFLPVAGDRAGHSSDLWRERAAGWARQLDLALVDLVPALRRLSAEEARALFIGEGELDFAGAGGHPSAAGHRWIADEIAAGLAAIGATADSTR